MNTLEQAEAYDLEQERKDLRRMKDKARRLKQKLRKQLHKIEQAGIERRRLAHERGECCATVRQLNIFDLTTQEQAQ